MDVKITKEIAKQFEEKKIVLNSEMVNEILSNYLKNQCAKVERICKEMEEKYNDFLENVSHRDPWDMEFYLVEGDEILVENDSLMKKAIEHFDECGWEFSYFPKNTHRSFGNQSAHFRLRTKGYRSEF